MDNKNQESLVPDMLFRHSDAPSPEESPASPTSMPLFSDMDIPDTDLSADAPAPDEASPLEEPIWDIPFPMETFTPDDPSPTVAPPVDTALPLVDVPPDEIPLAEMPPDEIPLDEIPLDEIPLEEMPPDEVPLDEVPLDEVLPDDISPEDMPLFTRPPALDTPASEPTQPDADASFSAPGDIYETFEPDPSQPAPDTALPLPDVPLFSDEMIQPPVQEESPDVKKKRTPPVKKGRPKRKKGDGFLGIPHLLATALWLVVIVAIGTSLGKLLWVGAADVLAFGREDKAVTVTIVASDDIDSIAAKLADAGLVRYPALFKFYATLTGSDEEITTGTFELNTLLDYHALTNALSPSSSSRSVVTVTIPEGYNCRQIFNLLASSNVCSVESLEEYASSGELNDYWFLEDVQRGDKYCLEGFLFPDTYEFYENSTPKEALTRMLNGFKNRFGEDLIAQIDTLNAYLADLMRADGESEEYIASHVYTVREVVTVASLIEKETAGSSESATIASVIYNRLFHWGDYPAYLNIDASILYVVDGDTSAFDTQLDSPFNTYTHTGLTPTPITNPGLTSIRAALNPESTGYYYYVLNPGTGLHQFSATQEEHDAWIEKFRTGDEE